MLHERLGALLQHRSQLGAARQRETNGRRQRCDVLRLLARAHLLFEGGRALGGVLHLHDAAAAGDDEEDVLEDHPGGVLQPAPLTRDQHAVDRLRPEDAAQQVIERHDDGGGNQDTPVAIKRQKRQRAEDVEMRFDASAGQVNQQRAHQHLRDGDRVARRGLAEDGAGRAPPGTGKSRRPGIRRPRRAHACG